MAEAGAAGTAGRVVGVGVSYRASDEKGELMWTEGRLREFLREVVAEKGVEEVDMFVGRGRRLGREMPEWFWKELEAFAGEERH